MQKMNLKASWMTFGLLLSVASNPSLAIEPVDIARLVEDSKAQLANLPDHTNGHPSVFVAVSLSMPKASLLRLAHDAKDAQIPLVFRGVITDQKLPYNTPLSHPAKNDQKLTDLEAYSTPAKKGSNDGIATGQNTSVLTSKRGEKELKVKVEVASKTMLETHGKHLLVRGMKQLEWLMKTGVTLFIDPQLFEVYGIHKVPVMVVADAQSRHADVKRAYRVEGDVTLAYALRHLEKELKVKINKESHLIDSTNDIHNYNKNVIGQVSLHLDRLGGRP